MKRLLILMVLFAAPAFGQGTQTLPWPTQDAITIYGGAPMFEQEVAPKLPPCAFGFERVKVLAKVKPQPSIDVYVEINLNSLSLAHPFVYPNETAQFYPPPSRMACPYELAVAKYGDERVRFEMKQVQYGNPATAFGPVYKQVLVCDDDGTDCTTVYEISQIEPYTTEQSGRHVPAR